MRCRDHSCDPLPACLPQSLQSLIHTLRAVIQPRKDVTVHIGNLIHNSCPVSFFARKKTSLLTFSSSCLPLVSRVLLRHMVYVIFPHVYASQSLALGNVLLKDTRCGGICQLLVNVFWQKSCINSTVKILPFFICHIVHVNYYFCSPRPKFFALCRIYFNRRIKYIFG